MKSLNYDDVCVCLALLNLVNGLLSNDIDTYKNSSKYVKNGKNIIIHWGVCICSSVMFLSHSSSLGGQLCSQGLQFKVCMENCDPT